MDKDYQDFKKQLSEVIAGNKDAEKELGVKPIKVDIPQAKLTRMQLKIAKQQHSEIAAAAQAVNLPVLEHCAKDCLKYINAIYGSIAKESLSPEVVEPQDYCQTVVAILHEIEHGVGYSRLTSDAGAQDTEQDQESQAEEVSGGAVGDPIEVEGQPEGDRRDSFGIGKSSEDAAAAQEPLLEEGQHVSDSGDSVIVAEKRESDGSGGEDGVEVVAGKDDGTGEDGVGGAGVSAGTSKQEEAPRQHYKDAQSKNKRRLCPFCDFFGVHLNRHLQSMHSDKVTSNKERARLVYLADSKEKKNSGESATITNKYERIYQCGIQGCRKIVSRMSQHLKRFHKITEPGKLEASLKKFKRLSGQRHRRPSKPKMASPRPTKKGRKKSKTSKGTDEESADAIPPTPQGKRQQPGDMEDDTTTDDGSFSLDDDSEDDLSDTASAKKPSKKPKNIRTSKRLSQETISVAPPAHKKRRKEEPPVEDETTDAEEFEDSSADESSGDELASGDGKLWSEYYLDSARRDKTVRGHFISTFHRYLLHAEGGAHSPEQALIHTRQVHTILETFDKDGNDLDCLVRNDSLDVWDIFAGPRLKSEHLKGNTLKVYIRSLEYFTRFIQKNLFFKKDLLTEEDKAAIANLHTRLPDYRATIHRRTALQTTTRKVEEAFAKMTPDDIKAFENSELAMQAVKLLGEDINFRPLSKKEFVTVRDFLLVTTLYENGSRPGPLENAKLSRFKRATYTESSRRWTILVDEHKTTRHQGPAELVVDERLYGYLKLYVEYSWPSFVAAGVDSLFIKDDGFPFRKGTIGRRISDTFQAAGVRPDIRVSATNIRKIYSSAAQQLSPSKKRLLHSHMKHKESTAEANYVIRLNAEKSSKAHEIMREIITGKQVDELDGDIWKSQAETSEQKPEDKKAHQSHQVTSELRADQGSSAASEQEDVNPSSCRVQSSPVREQIPHAAKVQLTNEDKVVLLSIFQDEIKRGQLLTRNEVKGMLRADNHLKKILVDEEKIKKACDFIRYKTNTVHQTQLTEVSDPYDFVTESSVASGLRKTWDPALSGVIESRMQNVTKMPTKRDLIQLFTEDNILKHVLNQEGKQRCYEKVKNLFRRRAKE